MKFIIAHWSEIDRVEIVISKAASEKFHVVIFITNEFLSWSSLPTICYQDREHEEIFEELPPIIEVVCSVSVLKNCKIFLFTGTTAVAAIDDCLSSSMETCMIIEVLMAKMFCVRVLAQIMINISHRNDN